MSTIKAIKVRDVVPYSIGESDSTSGDPGYGWGKVTGKGKRAEDMGRKWKVINEG